MGTRSKFAPPEDTGIGILVDAETAGGEGTLLAGPGHIQPIKTSSKTVQNSGSKLKTAASKTAGGASKMQALDYDNDKNKKAM